MSRSCISHLGERPPECPVCLLHERDQLRRCLLAANSNWAEDDLAIREMTVLSVPFADVLGDSHYRPTMVDCASMMAAECQRLRAKANDLQRRLDQVGAERDAYLIRATTRDRRQDGVDP